MLKAVRFKNFIKFEEDKFLQFNDGGAYLFVGENNSGKSSVLEAVRRCMDMKSNFSFTINVPNEADPTYAICDFSLPEDICERFHGHNRVVTSYVQFPGSKIAKVVAITDDGENQNGVLYIDIIVRGDYVLPSKNVQCQIDEKEKSTLFMNLIELVRSKDKKSDEFLNTVSDIIERWFKIRTETDFGRILKALVEPAITFGCRVIDIFRSLGLGSFSFMTEESYNFTEAERTLEALSEHIVFTFALRAVGGVQWSKSHNLRKGGENYSVASERCEIIKWFHDRQTDDNYDRSKADKIFKILTDGECFTFDFELSNGKYLLLVQNGMKKHFSILKCPEGILEAKYISLLLSYKPFRTLFLEEPDRGMHPQMIHRLRSIILAAEKDKTIIIISHNAAFISPMLIPRTFKFCKISNIVTGYNNASDRFEIVNIGNIITQVALPIPRIGNEEYASVLYARRILFVEGESDFIFVRGLFWHILNPETEASTKYIFNIVSKLANGSANEQNVPNDLKKLKYLLTSLHVLKLNGHGDKDKWHTFCEAIHTPHMFLLDTDAVIKTKLLNPQRSLAYKHAADIDNIISGLLTQEINNQAAVKNITDPNGAKVDAHVITEFLRMKFIQYHPSLAKCKNFSDDRKNITIRRIVKIATQRNIIHEKHFGRVYARFYGKIYSEQINRLKISQPQEFQLTQESNISNSRIVDKEGIKEFQQCLNESRWTDARSVLEKYYMFVWKDGSLEDAVLCLMLATNAGDEETKTDQIFRKYLAFYSLKIYLSPENFRRKHSAKLYLETSQKMGTGDERKNICEEDIQKSIDLVLKLCKKDSDIINFLHFMTMYALKEYKQRKS